MAAEAADRVADVVAEYRRDEADDGDGDDVQPARARVDGAGDEHGLTGHRDAEVLKQHQDEDRPQAVVLERAGQRGQETR